MRQSLTIKLISLAVSSYMLLALGWWTLLLLNKNEKLKDVQNYLDTNNIDYSLITDEKFASQKTMILGEGFSFGIALVLGIYMLYRVYKKELIVEQSKANFQMSITHELKTPVTAIKLTLDTLKRKLNLQDSLLDIYNQGNSSAVRLDNLINKLLLANRLDSANTYSKEPLDILSILKNRMTLFHKLYPDFTIKMESDNLMSLVLFDREGFISVVDNIIENAYKYSDKEKKLTIQSYRSNKILKLNFKDEGIGIPVDKSKKVTEKFYRIGDEMTRTSKGTGLGLYIVNKILKDHKTSFAIKQHREKGVDFEIQLNII